MLNNISVYSCRWIVRKHWDAHLAANFVLNSKCFKSLCTWKGWCSDEAILCDFRGQFTCGQWKWRPLELCDAAGPKFCMVWVDCSFDHLREKIKRRHTSHSINIYKVPTMMCSKGWLRQFLTPGCFRRRMGWNTQQSMWKHMPSVGGKHMKPSGC